MNNSINKIVKEVHALVQDNTYQPDLALMYSLMDVTNLTAIATNSIITELCESVKNTPEGLTHPAAICVYATKFQLVQELLRGTGINTAVVAAGFPHGQIDTDIKCYEVKKLISEGVDEIDIVINVPEALNKNLDFIANEIRHIKQEMPNSHLKVILEVKFINNLELIYLISRTALESGADFIKTSTGKEGSIAFPEAVIAMCLAIRDYYSETNKKRGFKVAGGVSEIENASLYLEIVRTILSGDWLNPSLFRIGTSKLQTKILEKLT